jgi:hypothetical protein
VLRRVLHVGSPVPARALVASVAVGSASVKGVKCCSLRRRLGSTRAPGALRSAGPCSVQRFLVFARARQTNKTSQRAEGDRTPQPRRTLPKAAAMSTPLPDLLKAGSEFSHPSGQPWAATAIKCRRRGVGARRARARVGTRPDCAESVRMDLPFWAEDVTGRLYSVGHIEATRVLADQTGSYVALGAGTTAERVEIFLSADDARVLADALRVAADEIERGH